jgi:hypothetical protein
MKITVDAIVAAAWEVAFEEGQRAVRKREETAIPGVPEEVGTERAAQILRCSKDTVLRYKDAGLLEYRNIAPPGSSRPVFAFPLQSVINLRTTYERDEPVAQLPKEPQRRRVRDQRRYKHLRIDA